MPPVAEIILATDSTARIFDADGRMHITRSHISKANVCPYFGAEIPGYEALGLDPNKIYKLFRSPEELKKAAHTFARLPILKKHIPISSEYPKLELIVGTIGSDVEFNDPYLDADLCFWTDQAIAGIETSTIRELSCAYRYVPIMTPGEYNGEKYDGIMTEIYGNHLATVESGRAGSDVLAADSDPFAKGNLMKMTKFGKLLFNAVRGALPQSKIAQDAGLPALFADLTPKTFTKEKKAEIKAKLLAMDATAKDADLEEAMDGMEEEEVEPKTARDRKKAKDGEPEHKPSCPGGADCNCGARDAEPEEKEEKKRAEDKKAMDEAIKKATDDVRRDLAEADQAKREVRPVVGEIIAQDSAQKIYEFALDTMKVEHAGVTDVAALRSIFKAANANKPAVTAPVLAIDAASAATRWPELSRFRNA